MTALALDVGLFEALPPLHWHAYQFYWDPARFVLASCGRRGAKTATAARRFLRKIFEDDWRVFSKLPYDPGAAKRGTALWWDRRPRMHYWVCAEQSDLLDEPKRYLLQYLPSHLLEHADGSKNRLWLKGDILIELVTIHDPDKKVGSGLNGLWVEEAARVKPNAWMAYLRPALADKSGWAQFTTTPLGQDWTFDQLKLKADPNAVNDNGDSLYDPAYSFHTWRTADNVCVPALQAEVEHARKTLPGPYFRREYEASYEAFIGQIYEDFDEHTMVADVLPAGVQLVQRLGGQDWGFTAPGAQLAVGITAGGHDRCHLWFLDETYSPSRLVEDFWVPAAQKRMAKWGIQTFVADPAEPDNLFRFRGAGIPVVGHKNYGSGKFDEHDRSVRAGIRLMASLMHQGRFHVLRKGCPNLISELKSYRWDQNRGGVLIEKPAPGQKEHAATAARYVASWAVRGPYLQSLSAVA